MVDKGDSWGNGAMALLLIGTFLFPIIGLIGGIVGLSKPATRGQGTVLLIFALVIWCAWAALMLGAK